MDHAVVTDPVELGERAEAAFERAVADVPEARLLERAATGDVVAFDALIRTRLDRLFRMAVAITRSEADARDAVQEASVHAWRELPRLRDRSKFDAWLSQILVNACRSLLRRERRVRVREVDVEQLAADRPDDEGFATGSSLDDLSETDLIQRAFARLDPTVRSLLVLHYVEERPLAEIGRILGSPVGTIKWRLSNARRALDRALEVERR
jgi:RNA polymerase sigma-70 factor (ECF subfamily)